MWFVSLAAIELATLPAFLWITLILAVVMLLWDTVEVGRNDAANLVNAAYGARVLTQKWAVVVAGSGCVIGAALSSDVVDTARKGIFDPGMLASLGTPEQALKLACAIYISVYIVDTVLLYGYSAFGMPVSTTACLVFELLGAALAVGGPDIIHWPKAGKVIFAISVALGTVLGIFAAVALTPDSKGAKGGASAKFGALSVATAPAGAEIRLDDQLLKNELGRPLVTPAEVERLLPGPHRLKLAIPGYAPWEGEIRVRAATRMPVKKHLVLTPGLLKVTSTPTGARVFLDGEERGRTPMIIRDIDRGRDHQLKLEATGRKPLEQKLSMEEEELELRLELAPMARVAPRAAPVRTPTPPRRTFKAVDAPEAASATRVGWLSLNSIPSAQIFIDGRDTRKSTPASRMRLSAGRHTVRLENKKLSLSQELELVIRAGETHTRRVDFRGRE